MDQLRYASSSRPLHLVTVINMKFSHYYAIQMIRLCFLAPCWSSRCCISSGWWEDTSHKRINQVAVQICVLCGFTLFWPFWWWLQMGELQGLVFPLRIVTSSGRLKQQLNLVPGVTFTVNNQRNMYVVEKCHHGWCKKDFKSQYFYSSSLNTAEQMHHLSSLLFFPYRDSVMEILFEQDNEEKSVATLILDTLVKVQIKYETMW